MDVWGDCFRLINLNTFINPVSGLAFQVADVIFCNAYSLDLQKILLHFTLQYLNADSKGCSRVRNQALNIIILIFLVQSVFATLIASIVFLPRSYTLAGTPRLVTNL